MTLTGCNQDGGGSVFLWRPLFPCQPLGATMFLVQPLGATMFLGSSIFQAHKPQTSASMSSSDPDALVSLSRGHQGTPG